MSDLGGLLAGFIGGGAQGTQEVIKRRYEAEAKAADELAKKSLEELRFQNNQQLQAQSNADALARQQAAQDAPKYFQQESVVDGRKVNKYYKYDPSTGTKTEISTSDLGAIKTDFEDTQQGAMWKAERNRLDNLEKNYTNLTKEAGYNESTAEDLRKEIEETKKRVIALTPPEFQGLYTQKQPPQPTDVPLIQEGSDLWNSIQNEITAVGGVDKLDQASQERLNELKQADPDLYAKLTAVQKQNVKTKKDIIGVGLLPEEAGPTHKGIGAVLKYLQDYNDSTKEDIEQRPSEGLVGY